MVLGRVSLLLRWSRPFPIGGRFTALNDSRGQQRCSSSSSSSSSSKLGEQRRHLCSNGHSNGNQFIATLGVFFTLPEQGVTSPEILSRCSATPVRQTSSSPLRFIAAAHAVMPWAFPGYHDESRAWLRFLDEKNVRYYAELRDSRTGTVLIQHEVVNLAKHPSRDVAALGLKGGAGEGEGEERDDREQENRFLDEVRSKGIAFSPLPLRRRLIGQSDALQIVGYEVQQQPQPGGLGQGDDPGMVFVEARGELAARTAMQAFVGTNHATLNPGMCGAAVLDRDLELCGCVEGVVPTAPPEAEVEAHVRALQGMPCVVEWKDLDALLTAAMGGAVDSDVDDESQTRSEEPPTSQKQSR